MNWYEEMNNQLLRSGNWQSHQLAVREIVQEHISHLKQRQIALILGAGNCRDIPLKLLAD